jgi:hypothetical protein
VKHRPRSARGWGARALGSWNRQLARGLQFVVAIALVVTVQSTAFAACGGTERWFVKVGTDPDAANIQLNPIAPITVSGLNNLPKLQNNVPHGDNQFRLPEERVVYQVSGRLVLSKTRTMETTTTSFIAEIPDPQCVPGKKGDPNTPMLSSALHAHRGVVDQSRGALVCHAHGETDPPRRAPQHARARGGHHRVHRGDQRAATPVSLDQDRR